MSNTDMPPTTDGSLAAVGLHINSKNITPQKREALIKMFGILTVKAMENAPNVRAERRAKEALGDQTNSP